MPGVAQNARRRRIDAVGCRDGIEGDSVGLSGNETRDEEWCRLMGPGIEDFLRLNTPTLKIKPEHAAIMRKAIETLEDNEKIFKKDSRKREISMADYTNLLNGLRDIDDLWDICPDKITFSGTDLDRNEMIELVEWLKTCRGGFDLNG